MCGALCPHHVFHHQPNPVQSEKPFSLDSVKPYVADKRKETYLYSCGEVTKPRISGPPATGNTFTEARSNPTITSAGRPGPRPLRSRNRSGKPRELRDLYQLRAPSHMAGLYHSAACPGRTPSRAEGRRAPNHLEDAHHRCVRQHPVVRLQEVPQGKFGAPSWKPPGILAGNVPWLHRVFQQRGRPPEQPKRPAIVTERNIPYIYPTRDTYHLKVYV